jgi:hypothetical protein
MANGDLHRQRIIIDTAEWQQRLEQLAEMRRAADEAPSANVRRSPRRIPDSNLTSHPSALEVRVFARS